MDDTSGFGPAMAQYSVHDQIRQLQHDQCEMHATLEAFRQQHALAASQLRLQSLEAALRTRQPDEGHDAVLGSAKAYEAYLKGE